MEFTSEERKKEKATAESHVLLSLGLVRTALLPSVPSYGSIFLLAVAAAFVLSAVNLWAIHRWKRRAVLELSSMIQIRPVAWFLSLMLFGSGLVETKALPLELVAVACFILAYAILGLGVARQIWIALVGKQAATETR